jgi:hypothetical protein
MVVGDDLLANPRGGLSTTTASGKQVKPAAKNAKPAASQPVAGEATSADSVTPVVIRASTLPVTGQSLWLVLLAALAFAVSGLAARRLGGGARD